MGAGTVRQPDRGGPWHGGGAWRNSCPALTSGRRPLASAPFRPDPPLRLPLLLASALAVLAGCDAFGEPERFYNDDARPPAVGALDLASLRDGQHVAGEVVIGLDLDSLAGRVERVALWIDGEEVEARTQAPFQFRIYTPGYPEGAHTVSAAVYVRRPNAGLLNLAGAPAVALTARLVFDQRPPTPVALASVELDGDRARLRWTASADPNFYAYLVVRQAPWTATSGWPAGLAVVDTLYDRGATTYLDAPFPHLIGARAEYQVRVWNRQDVSESPNTLAAAYGTQVPGLHSYYGGAGFSRDGAEMYTSSATGLIATSTADHRELRRLDYTALTPGGSPPGQAELDRTGTELFVAVPTGQGYGRHVHVVGAASFRPLRSFALPDDAVGFALGARGEAYSVGEGRLSVLDRQTGAVTARTEAVFGYPAHAVDVSPDGESLYVVSYALNGPGSRALHRVDVSGATPRVTASFDWQTQGGTSVQVADDGRLYVLTRGSVTGDVTVLDGRSMEQTAGFDLDIGGGWNAGLVGFQVVGERFYVSYQTPNPLGDRGGTVAEFDLATRRRLRSWPFAVEIGSVRTSGAGWLYVDQSRDNYTTWAVPL